MLHVGERLSQERKKKNLTIDEVARATKIKASFLLAIEKGEYGALPSSAYAKGFVKNYAAYLGLPSREITAFFRRDFDEERAYQVLPKGFSGRKDFSLQRRKIQQAAIFFFLVFGAFCLFLLFQYRYAFLNPPLAVAIPKEGAVVASTVTVTGSTDPNALVSINGDIVRVDSNGKFKKEVDVFSGKSTLHIVASNRFGRQTVIDRHIVVKPE